MPQSFEHWVHNVSLMRRRRLFPMSIQTIGDVLKKIFEGRGRINGSYRKCRLIYSNLVIVWLFLMRCMFMKIQKFPENVVIMFQNGTCFHFKNKMECKWHELSGFFSFFVK
jgi:hypothetical protein